MTLAPFRADGCACSVRQRRSLVGTQAHSERVVYRSHHQVVADERGEIASALSPEEIHCGSERFGPDLLIPKQLTREGDRHGVPIVETG